MKARKGREMRVYMLVSDSKEHSPDFISAFLAANNYRDEIKVNSNCHLFRTDEIRSDVHKKLFSDGCFGDSSIFILEARGVSGRLLNKLPEWFQMFGRIDYVVPKAINAEDENMQDYTKIHNNKQK